MKPNLTIVLRPSRAAVLCAVALLVGMALRGTLTHPAPAAHRPPAARDSTNPEPGPTRMIEGMPVGFAHSPAGAVAAAIAYVCDGQRLIDTPRPALPAAIRVITAANSANAQLVDIESRLSALQELQGNISAPITYHQSAIAVRVDSYRAAQATVAVWNVGVLSRAGVAAAQASWAISRVELDWERGDWKLSDETVVPGPAPLTSDSMAPATAADLASDLDGFLDVGATR